MNSKNPKWLTLLTFSLLSLVLVQGCERDKGEKQPKELLMVSESVEVAAPPEGVWAILGDFGNMQAWHPAIVKSDHEGGNTPGAKRTLYLGDDITISEELLGYDGQARSYEYRILAVDPKVLPVMDYVSEVRVGAGKDAGHSLVVWSSRFNSAGNEDMDQEKRDETSLGAIKSVYRGGLDNLGLVFAPEDDDGNGDMDDMRPEDDDGNGDMDDMRPEGDEGNGDMDDMRPEGDEGSSDMDDMRPEGDEGSSDMDDMRPEGDEGSSDMDDMHPEDDDGSNEEPKTPY